MHRVKSIALLPLFLYIGVLTQSHAQEPIPRRHILTPATMNERGFSISIRFTDQTIKEGDRPAARTGVVSVKADFDPAQGPAIREIGGADLELRDGAKLLALVPVEMVRDPQTGTINWIQFSLDEQLLMKASIVLTPRGEGNALAYAVPLREFRNNVVIPDRYLVVENIPIAFKEFQFIWIGGLTGSGPVLVTGYAYVNEEFVELTGAIQGHSFSFTVAGPEETSFRFTGGFMRDDAPEDSRPVLDGTLTKYRRGHSPASSRIRFVIGVGMNQ